MMANILNTLVGTWKLLNYEMTILSGSDEIGSTIHPAGISPLGRIVFTKDSYMSVLVTRSATNAESAYSPWNVATDDEVLRVARPMVTYCGRFHVIRDEKETYLSTQVAISLDPSWMGTKQTRKVYLEEEDGRSLLTLRPVQNFELPVSELRSTEKSRII